MLLGSKAVTAGLYPSTNWHMGIHCLWLPQPAIMASQHSAGVSASHSSTDDPTPPKKRYSVSRSSACERCRAARSRCSQDRPRCQRCRAYDIACVYENEPVDDASKAARKRRSAKWRQPTNAEHRPARHALRLESDPMPLNDKLASRQELSQLIQAFFVHVYPVQAMAFIHRARLIRQVEEGRASPLLIKSLCAISARFLPNADEDHVDGGIAPATWCQGAKIDLMTDLDHISTTKLAAVLCILNHEFNCGRTESAWIFISIAVRMARALGLNVENPDASMPWLEKETRRRLMWSTFCADCFFSAGWPEYSLISATELRIFLPSEEASFVLGMEQPGQSLEDLMDGYKSDELAISKLSSGLMTRWIWLMALRTKLLW